MADGSAITTRIRRLLRSPSLSLKKTKPTPLTERVTLEKVLGITVSSSSGLACEPKSGLLAYPAGCVVVLLNPKKNKQSHILNASRKTITAVAFSPDGKYLVTGESGHMPAVRVWDVAEGSQVYEFQGHKYGVACVVFSPNMKYIVSVGHHHDMIVNVWDWKRRVLAATNKVSSKVSAVSFSADSSTFVTVGNRHVKFWYIDASKTSKVNWTVPLNGRSGLLGEQQNNLFLAVACGRGRKADATFCITRSGLLCQFNERRLLEKWVDLGASSASCLSVSEELIFCGCSDGVVRVFNPENLNIVATIPRPHCLGVDVALGVEPGHLFTRREDARYPDTVALTFDPTNRWLSCVYNDHSLYVWDARDVRKVGKVFSALYHGTCVWGVEVYPEVDRGPVAACLPPGTFATCSSDNTVRLWNLQRDPSPLGTAALPRNIYSSDLLKVLYVDGNLQSLQDSENNPAGSSDKADPASADAKTGIRTLCVSPDGQHLASGDRTGNLRIYDLHFLAEQMKIEAHETEVMCLEYSTPDTGVKLLATASRDRLIHVLNAERGYSLEQTLDEHSSAVTAVKFSGIGDQLQLVSCGSDKSIYFRNAEKTADGVQFSRKHHVVGKTTLYDMDVDVTQKYAAIACQDRNIRIYNIVSGKQRKCYKGSQGEDGTLIKVQMDPSGMYIATSSSDKNLSIYDFYTGECVATMFGHSEIVTGMKFSNNCSHFISVSADSCVFVWRLNPELTESMRQRQLELHKLPRGVSASPPASRRISYGTAPRPALSSDSDSKEDGETAELEEEQNGDAVSNADVDPDIDDPFSVTHLPLWAQKQVLDDNSLPSRDRNRSPGGSGPPRRRWEQRAQAVKSMLDLRELEMEHDSPPSRPEHDDEPPTPPLRNGTTAPRSTPPLGGPGATTGIGSLDERKLFIPSNVEMLMNEMKVSHSEPRAAERCERPSSLALLAPHPEPGATQGITPDVEPEILFPAQGDDVSITSESEFLVKEAPKDQLVMTAHRRAGGHDARSPDSACYANSPAFSPRRRLDDSSLICDGNSSEDDDEEPTRSTHSDLSPVTPDHDRYHKYFGDSGADTPLSAETSGSRGPPRSGGETTTAAAAAGVGTPRHSITTKFRNNARSSPSRSSPSSPANSVTTTTLPQKDRAPTRKPVEFPVKSRPGDRRTSGVVDRAATPRGPQVPAASSRSPAASGAADRRRTPGLPGSGRPSDGTPTSSAMRKAASMYDLAQEEKYSLHAGTAKPQTRSVIGARESRAVEPKRSQPALPPKPEPRAIVSPAMRQIARKKAAASPSPSPASSLANSRMTRSVSMGDGLNCKNFGGSDDDGENSSVSEDLYPVRDPGLKRPPPRRSYHPSRPAPGSAFKSPATSKLAPSSMKSALVAPSTVASQSTVRTAYRTSLILELSKPLSSHINTASNSVVQVTEVMEEFPYVEPSRKALPVGPRANAEFHRLDAAKALAAADLSKLDLDTRDRSWLGNMARKDPVPESHESLKPKSGREKLLKSYKELVVNAENCEEAANDLLQSLQKAILLYHKIQSSETPVGSKHLASVLADAFDGARAQLSTLDRSEANASGGGRSIDANDDASCARGVDGDGPLLPDDASSSPGEDKTSALLEHYSNMLMSMLEKKMSGNKL
ncbi:LOW QUALITY PROTEIN: mitogen-activated protein kinase-binding protein 1-like [Lethenteron reissneri]|uniref:LOW QUALITY PROTEIN: mitogen-activated protein kinase-binding protein 1-like n=1 Tax=Lethenteron reissneri TaxID=7753 RepID=UPI002AB66D73|nr:LOW QUALITY PROTEIN: mitogen-activated protein kinase-binding protein 1-like [Lethenteron reissneri]